jgi:hypothetical protein
MQESEVSFDTFFSVFSGRLLVFSREDSEVFRVMNPIYIEKDTNPESKIAIIHVHGNEISAHDHGKNFARSNHLSFFSLTQSGERFLRLPTGMPEKMIPTTKFARIDANRIYSGA